MMRARIDADGDVSLEDLPPLFADTLLRVPNLLESDDERVRERLLPRVYEDDEEERQWERYGVPELEHLFRSRERLIGNDLRSLESDGLYTFRLRVPKRNVAAWIAGLNAARLALFVLHELKPTDMEADPRDVDGEEKQLAVFRIHNLALIQEILMRAKRQDHEGEISLEDDEE